MPIKLSQNFLNAAKGGGGTGGEKSAVTFLSAKKTGAGGKGTWGIWCILVGVTEVHTHAANPICLYRRRREGLSKKKPIHRIPRTVSGESKGQENRRNRGRPERANKWGWSNKKRPQSEGGLLEDHATLGATITVLLEGMKGDKGV